MLTFKQKVIHALIFATLAAIPITGVIIESKKINDKKINERRKIEARDKANFCTLDDPINF